MLPCIKQQRRRGWYYARAPFLRQCSSSVWTLNLVEIAKSSPWHVAVESWSHNVLLLQELPQLHAALPTANGASWVVMAKRVMPRKSDVSQTHGREQTQKSGISDSLSPGGDRSSGVSSKTWMTMIMTSFAFSSWLRKSAMLEKTRAGSRVPLKQNVLHNFIPATPQSQDSMRRPR